MPDLSFNPVDYHFKWTNDENGGMGWYEWDSEKAHAAALDARNSTKRELLRKGIKAKAWVNRNQLISRGGIGTNRPHIELVVNVYKLSY